VCGAVSSILFTGIFLVEILLHFNTFGRQGLLPFAMLFFFMRSKGVQMY
jgi:hypothetical protein